MRVQVLSALVLCGASSCSAPEPMPPPANVTVQVPGPPAPRLWAHACPESEFPSGTGNQQYSGTWEREFEGSSFTLDRSSCTVWLTGQLDDACKLVGGCSKHSRFTMHLSVSGQLSPSGSYGHMGIYQRRLQVDHVVSGTAILR